MVTVATFFTYFYNNGNRGMQISFYMRNNHDQKQKRIIQLIMVVLKFLCVTKHTHIKALLEQFVM